MSERGVARRILLALAKTPARLFRNNTGMAWVGEIAKRWRDTSTGDEYIMLKNPRPFRAGLVKGGGDYIGWMPVTVTQRMVGGVIAVFTSIEVKESAKSKRTKEQVHFSETVKAAGGKAGFAASVEDALRIVND